jgi:hypothetical protein
VDHSAFKRRMWANYYEEVRMAEAEINGGVVPEHLVYRKDADVKKEEKKGTLVRLILAPLGALLTERIFLT